MHTFRVYYMKPSWFANGICGQLPDHTKLEATHTFLRTVEATSLEHVYTQSQGEFWSPNGEARDMILSKGLRHTSMSVGDVAVDPNGDAWVVASMGFVNLTN